MPHGLAGPTRQVTLCHEPPSEIGAGGADVMCPNVDDQVVVTPRAAPAGFIDAEASLAGDVVVFGAAFPTTEVHDAFQLAPCPGAAKKAVVTFGD